MQLDFAELFNIQGDDCFKELRKQIIQEEKPEKTNETSPLMRPMRAVTSSGSISDMGLSSLPPSIATSFASLGELCMDTKLSEPEENCWEVCDAFLKSRHSALETTENTTTFGEMDATPRPTRPVSDFRKYKTELCRNWEKEGECQFGEGCIFAHGEGELRSETNNETLKLANQLLGSQELAPCRRTRRRRRKNGRRSEDDLAEEDDTLSVSFEESPKAQTPSPTPKIELRQETPVVSHHMKKSPSTERNTHNTSPVLSPYNHVQPYTPGLSPLSYPMHSHFPHFHPSQYPNLHNLHYVPSVPNFSRTMYPSPSLNVGIGEGNRQMRWT